jgi:polar amino acid transport system substrate-binding protein
LSRRVIAPRPASVSRRGHARALRAGVAGIGAVLLVSGCGSGSSSGTATASDGVKLVAAGKLTTCTHLPYAPFQSSDGGKVVGFDIDMMDLVAKKLGVTQTVVDTPFEGIKSGQDLNTGKCDVAAAGMTIKRERAKVIDFSMPYFNATQALLVRKGAPTRPWPPSRERSWGCSPARPARTTSPPRTRLASR